MARELITDGPGKVTAVSYIDKTTRTEKQIRCRAVVVAASALRVGAAAAEFKGPGLHQRSGELLGRCRQVSDRHDRLWTHGSHSGAGGHAEARHRRLRRHAHVHSVVGVRQEEQGVSRAAITSRSAAATACPASARSTASCQQHEGYGKSLKQFIRERYGSTIGLSGRGEMIPNEDSLLRHRSRGGGSLRHSRAALPLQVERSRAKQVKHMHRDVHRDHRDNGRHGYRACGIPSAKESGISVGGTIIHELGTIRMGNDRRRRR